MGRSPEKESLWRAFVLGAIFVVHFPRWADPLRKNLSDAAFALGAIFVVHFPRWADPLRKNLSDAAFVLGAIFVVHFPRWADPLRKNLSDAAFALGLAGVVFIIICVCVWGVKAKQDFRDPYLGYSFYLSVASLFLIAIGSVVVFAQGRRSGLSYVPTG